MSRRYHLQLSALIYVGLAVMVGIAAANRPNNLLVWIFGLMIAAVIVSGLVSGAAMMRVRAVRLDPRHGRVGEPLVIRYAIRNQARMLPLFGLRVEELVAGPPDGCERFCQPSHAWLMHVGGGETAHGEMVLWPRRRGPMRLGRMRIFSAFPFGLVGKSVAFDQPQTTLIYPRTVALREDFLRALVPGGDGGLRMTRRSGTGEDYYGMREYKPGDSMRQISWRRSATLDQLVTIERTRPSPPRARVVLDLRRPTEELRFDPGEVESPRELEERAITLAASVIRLAESQGYEIGLTVLGLDDRPTPMRRGHWHVEKLMGALASLDLDRPRRREAPTGLADAERAGVVVVAPDRTDPALFIGDAVDRTAVMHVTARQLSALVEGAEPPPRGSRQSRRRDRAEAPA
ncbi:MAG TPA: DUF58 domain-containing protein [Phycisphaerales bacterium]|nr:DUF58 domain-containing protein [Phycisphaerales bacterium]HMP36147.1 DUF58 domain-containing protein [Phycisphaerales bacterium]